MLLEVGDVHEMIEVGRGAAVQDQDFLPGAGVEGVEEGGAGLLEKVWGKRRGRSGRGESW